ncbi:hypothetical protein BDV06DRAFT_215283 [Aspergillus oleicola]
MPLKILITGAGIAGLSLAYNLSNAHQGNTEFQITIIERHPTLRTSGLQIDLRGHGIDVLKRMGLEKQFREYSIDEKGLAFVDSSGRSRAFFGAGKADKDSSNGVQGFSTDWEIMRGDLCNLFYGGLKGRAKGNTEVRFGVWVVAMEDKGGEEGEGVKVRFSDGKEEVFDLVVGADGIGSRTRRLMFGSPSSSQAALSKADPSSTPSTDPFVHSLGVYIGYFTVASPIPTQSSTTKGSIDPYIAQIYLSTARRILFTRRHSPQRYQVYIILRTDHPRMVSAVRGDVLEEKAGMAEVLSGAGWKANEIISLMHAAEDFYCDHLGVVRLDTWSQGAIGLVGDAAYAPSATTGMGTSSSVVGGYVLAGEILKYCSSTDSGSESGRKKRENIQQALKSYENIFRPFMSNVQEGIYRDSSYWDKIPSSWVGVALVNLVLGIVSFFRLDVVANYLLREQAVTGWKLPIYEGLDRMG